MEGKLSRGRPSIIQVLSQAISRAFLPDPSREGHGACRVGNDDDRRILYSIPGGRKPGDPGALENRPTRRSQRPCPGPALAQSPNHRLQGCKDPPPGGEGDALGSALCRTRPRGRASVIHPLGFSRPRPAPRGRGRDPRPCARVAGKNRGAGGSRAKCPVPRSATGPRARAPRPSPRR